MKNLDNIDDYISEKRVTVKRRYTDNHPAKIRSTAARIRSAVFSAMGDGVLTEEEMIDVLKITNAHKRWLKRNSSLFQVKEEEGTKFYKLSKFGNRVKIRTISQKTATVNETKTLNESEATPEMLLQVQQALPDLEKLIQKRSGVKVKLMAEMKREKINIHSDNLIGQIGPLGRTVFKAINVYFWGGDCIEKTNQIWFNPKLSYEHPSGGSNGSDFIWQSLWFKLDTNEWVEGRLLGR